MVAGVTTRFDWDTVSGGLGNVTAESVAGTVIRKYAYGRDVVRTSNGTTDSFVFGDPVGTVTHLVSSSGAVQAQHLTGAYGVNKTTSVIDPVVASNPIRFTGQYTDPITGNVYLRARQYNPALGAFTQVDPLQADVGEPYPSACVYGNNNPVVYTDLSGLRASKTSAAACGWANGGPIGAAMPPRYALVAPLVPGPKPGPLGPLPPLPPDGLFPTTTKPPAPKPPAPKPPTPVTTTIVRPGPATTTTTPKPIDCERQRKACEAGATLEKNRKTRDCARKSNAKARAKCYDRVSLEYVRELQLCSADYDGCVRDGGKPRP
jgi:RHS repeat-associated protein